jgi:hypothetical protein
MVHLLVRESREEEVWRWISTQSTRSKRELVSIRYEWRVTALKGLLMSKARLSINRSLDNAIEVFLRSTNLFVPEGGATSWMFQRLVEFKLLRAHETCSTINGGRRWDYIWPNTSTGLWEEAVRVLPPLYQSYRSDLPNVAKLAMYHIRTPDPEPTRMLLEDAMADPNHHLRKTKLLTTRSTFRMLAIHASDELRRMGRYKDAATLDAAREEIFPQPREYGDRLDRESIFAQGITAKKLPFPKFK